MKVVAGASSARESADYAYLQTSEISQAIYGAVYRGLLLKRTSTSDGSVQWTTTDKRVAIKRLDYDRVMRDESEGKSSERPMEEIKIMQYLQRHIASVGDHTLDEELTGEAIWARAEYGIREHNIMTSVDILTDNQYLYIVMPFCDGKELFDVIQEQKVSEAEARHYFKQILKAIETLQESGVCHRDISLDNIMVSSSGIITLIEFGMSLKIPYIINKNGNRQRCMIRPGRACGKPYYMSPEIRKSNMPFDAHAIDMWALGPILFMMVCGFPPFETASNDDVKFQYFSAGYFEQVATHWNLGLSHDLMDLLQRMLWADPKKRLSLGQVIFHPWMDSPIKSPENEISEFVDACRSRSLSLKTLKSIISSKGIGALFKQMEGIPQLLIDMLYDSGPSFDVVNHLFTIGAIEKFQNNHTEICKKLASYRKRKLDNLVYAAAKRGGKCPIKRGRLAFVGQGRSGKSSTIASLSGEPFDGARQSTAGAKLEEKNLNIRDLGMDLLEMNISYKSEVGWKKAKRDGKGKDRALRAFLTHEGTLESASNDNMVSEDERKRAEQRFQDKFAPKMNPVEEEGKSYKRDDNDDTEAGRLRRRMTLDLDTVLKPAELMKRKNTATENDGVMEHSAQNDGGGNMFRLSVWDYGGQPVFHVVQHLYLHENCFYVVVFSLHEIMGARDERKKDEAIGNIIHWIKSIILQAVSKEECEDPNSEPRHAPILLVGTHLDSIKQLYSTGISNHGYIKELKIINETILNELGWDKKPPVGNKSNTANASTKGVADALLEVAVEGGKVLFNRNEDLCFWPVDNSNPNDPNVIALRGLLRDQVLNQDYVKDFVPIPWLGVIDELVNISAEKYVMPLETTATANAASIIDFLRKHKALQRSSEDDRAIAIAFLKFCHGLGLFLYFDGIPGLQDLCILNPQWVIDQTTYLIRDFKLHRFPRDHDAMKVNGGASWKRLLKKGILDMPLLQKLWNDADLTHVEYLINFMEMIGIFGMLPNRSKGQEVGPRVLVPALITRSSHRTFNRKSPLLSKVHNHIDIESRSVEKCTRTFKFQSYLFIGFYDRLVTALVNTFFKQQSGIALSYEDPELLKDGCLLHAMVDTEAVPIAIHLNVPSSSIDIIANSNNDIMEMILSDIELAFDAINTDIYGDRLKIDYPVKFPVKNKFYRSAVAGARNNIHVKEYKNLDTVDTEGKIKAFADCLKEHGSINDKDLPTELATKIIEVNRNSNFYDLKIVFDDICDEEMFKKDVLKEDLGILNLANQISIIKALRRCPKLQQLEHYLVGYFRDDELHNVAREKKAIENNINGTIAQLSAHVNTTTASDLMKSSIQSKYKVLHLAMHGAKGKDGEHTLTFTSKGKPVAAKKIAKALAKRCDCGEGTNKRQGSAKCVFLNSCFSFELAGKLDNHGVPCTISWKTKVNDEAAMTFAETFYHYLSSDREEYENFEEAFEEASYDLELRDWCLIDPEDKEACSELDEGEQAAGIPHIHITKMASEVNEVGPNQFRVNGVIIDLPNEGEVITRSVAEATSELLLYFARYGVGENLAAKGMLVVVGSDEHYNNIGYIDKDGINRFNDKDVFVVDWKKSEHDIKSCFVQDEALFINGKTGRIMAEKYKVDLLTRNADQNGGTGHKSASAAGAEGCVAFKCSEDSCATDGTGKGELKIFSGIKEPVKVLIKDKIRGDTTV